MKKHLLAFAVATLAVGGAFAQANDTLAKVKALGGDGGVIAIDRAGNIALPFNTPGMYRAHHLAGQAPEIAIFR